MELETLLLNAMLEAGASPSLARIHAADFAAVLRPRMAREKRDQDIADLFYQASRPELAERFGVCRRTIYNALERARRLCNENADTCTVAKYDANPREA